MLKHLLAIIILSILVIIGLSYVEQLIHWILLSHDWVSNFLKNIFLSGKTGNIIRELIAILFIPIAIALIPSIIYWFLKRTWFPYFVELVWIIWLIQTTALVVLDKT